MTDFKDFATTAIHAGTAPDSATGAIQTPIYQTACYQFDSAEHAAKLFGLKDVGMIYSRLTNPTVFALQGRIAAMEGAVGACCAGSGHAAQLLALFALMRAGDNLVASRKLYGGSLNQFSRSIQQFGWDVKFADNDADSIAAQIDGNTKAVFIESLANPGGIVSDIEAIAKAAHDKGVPLIVDNTMASPYLCNPLKWGADIVVQSTTKFLSGNGTSVGGVVMDSGKFDWSQGSKFPNLTEGDKGYHGMKFAEAFGPMAFTFYNIANGLRDLGAAMAPFNAFLTLLGTETLPLRMEKHSSNALALAKYLQGHDKVAWVSYSGLADSEYNGLAKKYMRDGMGGAVFTFGLKAGYDAGVKLVDSVKLFHHVANIGDTRSLIIHPSSTTHSQLSEEARVAAGAGPDVVRLSVGLEGVEDLIADLEQGLDSL